MARKSSSTATPKQEDNVAKTAEQEKPLTEEQQSNGQAEQAPEPVKIPDNAVEVNGTHYVPIDEVAGKKGLQVAKLVAELKQSKGTPVEFNALCASAEAKYPQDVQAAMFALQLAGLVTHYVELGKEGQQRAKAYYAWTGEARPQS